MFLMAGFHEGIPVIVLACNYSDRLVVANVKVVDRLTVQGQFKASRS